MKRKPSIKPLKLVDGSRDAGLVILSALTERGETRTLEDIAFVCGCTKQNIQNIEKNALRKIKAELIRRGVIPDDGSSSNS